MRILVPFFLFFLFFFLLVHFGIFGILDRFDVFVLVFLRFRFNKNARAVKQRKFVRNVDKVGKGNEILKGLEQQVMKSIFERSSVSDSSRISSFERVPLSLEKC